MTFENDLVVGKEDYDYDLFCSNEKVQHLFSNKDKLDSVDKKTFLDSRRRANPYEIIGKSIFINRAAVKLANLDYLCERLVPPRETEKFFFCDVCAGPGGFTEYVLWKRHGVHSRGWGMTLKGNDDWKFYRFNELSNVRGRFEAIYGPDGQGNVYKEENLKEFQRVVLSGTDGKGVQLFTADGGFCVDGNENYQEVEVKRLVLDQFLCALCVLGKGGNFVCKIFDCFTPFTIGLLYILYRCFEKFAIVKPVTSRPANSERYVVCKNFLQQNPPIIDYLFRVNAEFDKKPKDEDVIRVVDLKTIQKDTQFIQYMRESNLRIIDAQIAALDDLVLYIEDLMLAPFADQKTVQEYALRLWGIPPQPTYRPQYNRRGGYNRGQHRQHNGGYNGGYNRGYNGDHNRNSQHYRSNAPQPRERETGKRERPYDNSAEHPRKRYSDGNQNDSRNKDKYM